MIKYALPAVLFFGLLILFALGLGSDPSRIPSPFIDKPVPAFDLPRLKQPSVQISHEDLRGEVTLLNVWASWCVACRHEHELLLSMARDKGLRIVGLNYKDERPDAIAWLNQLGDPYRKSAHDYEGKVGIDLGVYGVPETFVLDKHGIIRYKHIGPITNEVLTTTIYPLLRELRQDNNAPVALITGQDSSG